MAPTSPSVPAGTTLGKSYEYGIDVDTTYPASGAAVWQPVRRISDLQPGVTPKTQDAQTYDDFGSSNADKTGEDWTLGFSVLGNRLASTGEFLPEVQAIIDTTKPSAKGEDAVLHIRYYHKPESGTPDPTDAYEGFATVAVSRANAGADGAVERLTVTLTGKGPRKEITNPFTGWTATVPTLSSALPSGAAAGAQVTIKGTGFSAVSGAAGVKFGATNATSYTVVDPTTIVAIVPTGTAGSAPIIVTSTAGASTALPYTRA